MRSFPILALAGVLLGAGGAAAPAAAQTPQKIVVTSPTLEQGQPVPWQHTPDGRNASPALSWSNVPAGTKEFAVVCEDPGAGNPPPFVHWLMYKIPGTAKGLPEALPIYASAPLPAELNGAIQGTNGFRRPLYRGPAPPPGKVHDYHFIVYALDTNVVVKPDQPPLTRAQLLEAIDGHIIGKGELVAHYERH
jgi:Raf kinase inhibitor-like YbhB/YbcL family protein